MWKLISHVNFFLLNLFLALFFSLIKPKKFNSPLLVILFSFLIHQAFCHAEWNCVWIFLYFLILSCVDQQISLSIVYLFVEFTNLITYAENIDNFFQEKVYDFFYLEINFLSNGTNFFKNKSGKFELLPFVINFFYCAFVKMKNNENLNTIKKQNVYTSLILMHKFRLILFNYIPT